MGNVRASSTVRQLHSSERQCLRPKLFSQQICTIEKKESKRENKETQEDVREKEISYQGIKKFHSFVTQPDINCTPGAAQMQRTDFPRLRAGRLKKLPLPRPLGVVGNSGPETEGNNNIITLNGFNTDKVPGENKHLRSCAQLGDVECFNRQV